MNELCYNFVCWYWCWCCAVVRVVVDSVNCVLSVLGVGVGVCVFVYDS